MGYPLLPLISFPFVLNLCMLHPTNSSSNIHALLSRSSDISVWPSGLLPLTNVVGFSCFFQWKLTCLSHILLSRAFCFALTIASETLFLVTCKLVIIIIFLNIFMSTNKFDLNLLQCYNCWHLVLIHLIKLQQVARMEPRQHLRSSSLPALVVPATRRSSLGDRAFLVLTEGYGIQCDERSEKTQCKNRVNNMLQ